MIFPILRGVLDWRFAPVTWAIVLLNFLVLLVTTATSLRSESDLERITREPFYLGTQGRLYAHYLQSPHATHYPRLLRELGENVERGESEGTETLGSLAFRDSEFLRQQDELGDVEDPVAYKHWLKTSATVHQLEDAHPSFALGLNSDDPSLTKWVSYIFVHSGFLHFAGNMLFLLLFGAALEAQIGGLAVLVCFVLFGVIGAGFFALLTGVTSSPLVGASGAISGIMTLYCLLNWRTPTRFVYWLFVPLRGYIGFIYLPAWIALAMALGSDVAGFIATVPELGGIAHAAHLGGDLAGVITAAVLFALRRGAPNPARDATVPTYTLLPFFP